MLGAAPSMLGFLCGGAAAAGAVAAPRVCGARRGNLRAVVRRVRVCAAAQPSDEEYAVLDGTEADGFGYAEESSWSDSGDEELVGVFSVPSKRKFEHTSPHLDVGERMEQLRERIESEKSILRFEVLRTVGASNGGADKRPQLG